MKIREIYVGCCSWSSEPTNPPTACCVAIHQDPNATPWELQRGSVVTMISAEGVGIWELDGFSTLFPSGYVKIAIENDNRNSGFPHETWILSIVM